MQLATALDITEPGVYNLFKREKIKQIQLESIYAVIDKLTKETLPSHDKILELKTKVKNIKHPKSEEMDRHLALLESQMALCHKMNDTLTEQLKFVNSELSKSSNIIAGMANTQPIKPLSKHG